MEKFVAKAELNVYGICTIPEATGEVTGHLITFYATYQEAYNVYKARYGNRATVSSESPAYKNTDFIHRFIIPKGVSYTRDDFEIIADELQFAETIFNIETYGKNNNQ